MGNQDTKSAHHKVEKKWRSKLLGKASSEDFMQAYDELASCPLQKTRVGLSRVDKIILEKVGSHKRVLEIGFGDGRLSAALAKQGNSVVGMDISVINIKRAKASYDSNPLLDLHFVHGDARYLDFEDASFDYIISQNLIEHLSAADGRNHLLEAHRVLRKDGCYLFAVPNRITKGYRSAGFHLWMYSLQEMVQLVSSLGFRPLWIEPKLIKWLGVKREIPSTWLAPVFWYERVLGTIWKIFLPNRQLKIRGRKLAPTVMLAAYKES